MHVYLRIFGLHVPTYSLMILAGLIVANLIAVFIIKRRNLDIYAFIIMEAYSALGAFIGAKLLYLIVSYKYIEWNRLLEYEYLDGLLRGGFVFYGGLFGGMACIFLGGRIHGISAEFYLRNFIFLIPLVHCFGRIGCFMAGCCYGIPYHGFGAVTFPDNSLAPPGIELFPIQLVEAICLLVISAVIFFVCHKYGEAYSFELYLLLYGIARFLLEFLRYDAARGIVAGLSTSQWISLLMIFVSAISYFFRKRTKVVI